jgi:hypothetical protein
MLSQPTGSLGSATASESELAAPQQCELLICATHFLGDGMALHRFANDFFIMLGSTKTQHELWTLLHDEWLSRCSKADNDVSLYANDHLAVKLNMFGIDISSSKFDGRSDSPRREVPSRSSSSRFQNKPNKIGCKFHL